MFLVHFILFLVLVSLSICILKFFSSLFYSIFLILFLSFFSFVSFHFQFVSSFLLISNLHFLCRLQFFHLFIQIINKILLYYILFIEEASHFYLFNHFHYPSLHTLIELQIKILFIFHTIC